MLAIMFHFVAKISALFKLRTFLIGFDSSALMLFSTIFLLQKLLNIKTWVHWYKEYFTAFLFSQKSFLDLDKSWSRTCMDYWESLDRQLRLARMASCDIMKPFFAA